jgi:acetyl/propionyl-CoA carboxylase alpha subunit
VHYDPLIAKVIATAATRDEATTRLVCALRAFPILGLQTNIPFLLRILDHPRFRSGEIDTSFLDSEGASLAAPVSTQMPAAVRAVLENLAMAPSAQPLAPTAATLDPWEALSSWRR